ncbi:GumC domain-containing protein [Spirosoma gilvum]
MVSPTEVSSVLQPDRRYVSADQLLRIAWQTRYRALPVILVSAIIGVLVAFLLPQEFRAEARIMPEMNTSAGSLFKRLSSVAAFADLDLSEAEGMDAIRPDLYPNVLQSTPFVLHLIDQAVTMSDGRRTTVGHFLLPDSTGWSLKKWVSFREVESIRPVSAKGSGTVRLSNRQQELAEELDERISARQDTRSGIITIVASMPDAEVAAQVAQLALNYLTNYVTSYRTEKARKDLAFYTKQLAEARQRYQAAQLKVFQYNDNHRNLVLQTVAMERYRLDADVVTTEAVFAEMARQYEQARLKVQEQTPVFKVLEPPKVPHKRTSPKRTLIVLGFALAGWAVSMLLAIVQQPDVKAHLKTMVTSVAAEAV